MKVWICVCDTGSSISSAALRSSIRITSSESPAHFSASRAHEKGCPTCLVRWVRCSVRLMRCRVRLVRWKGVRARGSAWGMCQVQGDRLEKRRRLGGLDCEQAFPIHTLCHTHTHTQTHTFLGGPPTQPICERWTNRAQRMLYIGIYI